MKLYDMNETQCEVNGKNFYDWNYGPLGNNHIYGGYRDKSTGEIYIIGGQMAWRGNGIKLFDTNQMKGIGANTWAIGSDTTARYALARLRKKTGKKADAFEKVNVVLEGTGDYDDQSWERRGYMPCLTYSLHADPEKVSKSHMTPKTYKEIENGNHRIYYPVAWPLPKTILNIVKETIVCEEGVDEFTVDDLVDVEIKVV